MKIRDTSRIITRLQSWITKNTGVQYFTEGQREGGVQWGSAFPLVSLYDCHCNFLYERFHLSERLCALGSATGPFIGEHREKTFGNELPRSKGETLRCDPDQSVLVPRLTPPKSRAHVLFDIGNGAHFLNVRLIEVSTLYRARRLCPTERP